MNGPSRTVEEVAQFLSAEVVGDGTVVLTGIAPIEEAGSGELSFVANPKYASLIDNCTASALVTSPLLETTFEPRVLSANPYLAFTKAMQLFIDVPKPPSAGVSTGAIVHAEADVASTATVHHHAVVERGACVGANTVIEPGVVIGECAAVGIDCHLEANVVVGPGSIVGDRCILHAGTQVGGATGPDGEGQLVDLGPDVELGANVVVQGGSARKPTRLGPHCKVDNLVNIGAGCGIGAGCILVSQVTLGCDVQLGSGVTLAGQVTVVDACKIGDRAVIGAKSLVDSDVPVGGRFWGVPAIPHNEQRRAHVLVGRIPKMERMLEQLRPEEDS